MRDMLLKLLLMFGILASAVSVASAGSLRVATFDVDASPPIESPLAYDPNVEVTTPLSCRGIVLLGDEAPIVLCAVDWIGIRNGGNELFREQLAAAAGTTPDRVAVHVLHPHDAPQGDFSVTDLAAQLQISGFAYDAGFARDVLQRAAATVRGAVVRAQPVTHLGIGSAPVENVASNRRILGPDGKVEHIRWTATRDPEVRAFPEGVIDQQLKLVSFWNGDQPLVTLTYYATHPQSYYRTGQANPDFPGLARNARDDATGVLHVHFDGAGGNIGAGKYNDGSHENRQVLADRMEDGMRRAWEAAERIAVSADDLDWSSVPVLLPPADHLDKATLLETLHDDTQPPVDRQNAARRLVWLERCLAEDPIDVSCLSLGDVRILHLPGELFVEYQLAAQKLRPDLFVCMAAYGDGAPGYIGTRIAYNEGGYEPSPRASLVAPDVEDVLIGAIRTLLDAENVPLDPLGVAAHEREVAAARERTASPDESARVKE